MGINNKIGQLIEDDENEIKEIENRIKEKIVKSIKEYFKIGKIVTDYREEIGTIVGVDNNGVIIVELNEKYSKKLGSKVTAVDYRQIEVKGEN
ncbi:hypothetical protein [Clostridium perfringens]|uniref:hypothetical protein n=1 Tax=Clostridium perfringens TaxID=1502 RepID=UPI0024BC1E2C|nr:hypothetical protein [Clostridium perfringens]